MECSVEQMNWVYAVFSEMATAQNCFVITEQGKFQILPASGPEAFYKQYTFAIHEAMRLIRRCLNEKEALTRVFAVAYLSAWIRASSGEHITVTRTVPHNESEYLRFLEAGIFLDKVSAKTLKAMPITKIAMRTAHDRIKHEFIELYSTILALDPLKRKWATAAGKFVNLMAYYARFTPNFNGEKQLNKFHLQAEYWIVRLGICSDISSAQAFLEKIKLGDNFVLRGKNILPRFKTDNAMHQAANRGKMRYHEILCLTYRSYAIPSKMLMETKSEAVLRTMDFTLIQPAEDVFSANFLAGNIDVASPINVTKE